MGCGDDSGTGDNNNTTVCEGDDDCLPGWQCVGNICVEDTPQPDAAVDLEPDIVLSASALDFEAPLLGVEVTLPLTIHNVGQGDLTVSQILVEETGALQEYHADHEGSVSLIIPPGGQQAVMVSLTSVDDELDVGNLRINSDDPDSPSLLVALVSEHKGVPDIAACAIVGDASQPFPDPPYDNCDTDINGDGLLDFGTVELSQPRERLLAVTNETVGNAPLTIDGVQLANLSGQANTFTVTTWMEDSQTGVASLVSMPVFLAPGDTVNAIPPTVLYVHVAYNASLDVFPTEQLEIESSDPAAPVLYVPVTGAMNGCPPGFWDVDGDPLNGCEYPCTLTLTYESCTPAGVDDDCDGATDDEGAAGCTVYFADSDLDGVGDAADSRCLCAPVGIYTAISSGDCNDSDNTVAICSLDHATAVCVNHACQVQSCDMGYDNCDNQHSTGCEVDLSDLTSCGSGCSTLMNCATLPDIDSVSCVSGSCVINDCLTGMAHCDTSLVNGCEVTLTDPSTCGSGCSSLIDCTALPNVGTTTCPAGNCVISSCTFPYGDCTSGAGCETNLNTNTDRCGSCTNDCDGKTGVNTAVCTSGSCVVTDCDNGYCDLDNDGNTGCEHDLDTNPACSQTTLVDLGSIAGDDSSVQSVDGDYRGERWFKIELREDFNNFYGPHAQVILTPATGTDYDLEVFCESCGTGSSMTNPGGLGAQETVYVRVPNSTFGVDDTKTVYIKVTRVTADICDTYNLAVYGYLDGSPQVTCN